MFTINRKTIKSVHKIDDKFKEFKQIFKSFVNVNNGDSDTQT